jgi:hypothetical protein
MTMTKLRKSILPGFTQVLAVVLAIAVAVGNASAQTGSKKLDKSEVLQRANDAYYVLQTQGLKTFQCNIQPNWKQMFEGIRKNTVPDDDPLLVSLVHVQFSVTVDDQGRSKVASILPTGGNLDPTANRAVDDFRVMFEGFFQFWSLLAFKSIFPSASEIGSNFYQESDGYHFGEQQEGGYSEYVLTKAWVLTTMKMVTRAGTVVVHPRFTKTSKGLLLASMNVDLNNGTHKISFEIQDQEISGFHLPSRLVSHMTMPTQQVLPVESSFYNFSLTLR